MSVLVTGAAGFIGFHVAQALLARGERVVGFDNVNAYYDPALKEARLALLARRGDSFAMRRGDLADAAKVSAAVSAPEVDRVVHLAAQAGVRHSLTHPEAYVGANLVGHFNVLEACRRHGGVRHLVYASSSSVYGGSARLPFAIDDKVDAPISLYAATKAADELMSHAYAHLHGLKQTGLRFFTVYGPWGRPDMSAWLFTAAILAGRPITVFNRGEMRRDFTFVDDVVAGVIAALDRPPGAGDGAPHRRYNLGNHRAEELMRFIAVIERATNRKATIEFAPLQPGDVRETFADIEASRRDLGFEPRTTIDEGVPIFVDWFRRHHGL